MRYHINSKGEPAGCAAQAGCCPFEGEEEHYSSSELARREFENQWRAEIMPPPHTKAAAAAKPTRKAAVELDQFFTQDEVAVSCLGHFAPIAEKLGYSPKSIHFVEPSTGGGSFVRAAATVFPRAAMVQGDIYPQTEEAHELNFLEDDLTPLRQGEDSQQVVIGNPPFGWKGQMAKDFINRAFELSDTVAFVIPNNFSRFKIQQEIDEGAMLVRQEFLPRESFAVNGSSYGVGCVFQVWMKRESDLPDLRKRTPLPTVHEDFDLWYVSSAKVSKRHLEAADWELAIPCQGFKGDFDEIIERKGAHKISPKKQYMLMKPKTPEAAERLRAIDFASLAEQSTTKVRGFGKGDLIERYITKL